MVFALNSSPPMVTAADKRKTATKAELQDFPSGAKMSAAAAEQGERQLMRHIQGRAAASVAQGTKPLWGSLCMVQDSINFCGVQQMAGQAPSKGK